MEQVQQQTIPQKMQRMTAQQLQTQKNKLGVFGNHLSGETMTDYCKCGKLKKDCEHPNCCRDGICPDCNQNPCTCINKSEGYK